MPSPTGRPLWSRTTVASLLDNPAYQGTAGYGKSRLIPRQPTLRPRRGQSAVPRRPYSVTCVGTEPQFLEVPALVSVEEFAAVAAQLEENRQRQRARRTGVRHLLQGLLVCQHCGYGWHGVTQHRQAADGTETEYNYYRCWGRRGVSPAGEPRCVVRPVRSVEVEAAVWQDVCGLLTHPEKVEEEYQRRLEGFESSKRGLEPLTRVIEKVRRTLARLIDAYGEGLLKKEEFEPRVQAARERLGRLEEEAQAQAAEDQQTAELRLAMTCLRDFAAQVRDGLTKAEWATRREIIRALVKRVEMGNEEVRIVYRVAPVPFVDPPPGGVWQHCQKCHDKGVTTIVVTPPAVVTPEGESGSPLGRIVNPAYRVRGPD